MYYLSNAEANGRDDHCERLGFGRLNEYDSEGRCWKYLSSVFEENSKEELTFPSEDELVFPGKLQFRRNLVRQYIPTEY